MKTTAEIQNEINKLSQELTEVNCYESELAKGDPKTIAIHLHSVQCKQNHTDGCGWYYEIKNKVHDWNGHSHKRYLASAESFIDTFGTDNIAEKLQILSWRS